MEERKRVERWNIESGSQFRSLTPHDQVYVGVDINRLFLLQPRNATYSCTINNYGILPIHISHGYIRVIVEGECHLIISAIIDLESTAPPALNFLVHPQDISVKRGTRYAYFECIPGGGG